MLLRPRSHDTGMKLCWLKIITFSTIHTVPVELYLLQLLFISLLKFARKNVLHNRNKTYSYGYRRSHGSLTVEFRSVFKVLRYVYRFQALTVSVTVSHNFIPASRERNP